ncbi:MAG: hypothetical protein AB7U62_10045 [Pseudolabrys sp.]
MTAIPAWTDSYVGIPFLDRGATRDGCNCYGLVRLVLQERAGIALPTYSAVSATAVLAAARAFSRAKLLPPWQPVAVRGPDEPSDVFLRHARSRIAAMDLVLMTRRGRAAEVDGHIGIMVTPQLLLHVEESCDAVVIPLDEPSVRERVNGIYRHEALA